MKGPDWSVIGVGLKVELRNVTPDGGRNDPERFGGSVSSHPMQPEHDRYAHQACVPQPLNVKGTVLQQLHRHSQRKLARTRCDVFELSRCLFTEHQIGSTRSRGGALGSDHTDIAGVVHRRPTRGLSACGGDFLDATMAMIERVLDDNARPPLNPAAEGITSGPSNTTLLGYPVVIDQAWPTYADATTGKWGVFGDLKAGYVIRRVKDLTLIVNPYSRANESQVGIHPVGSR